MAIVQPTTEPNMEAVIISGTRKGEFITIGGDETAWTPEVEAMLNGLVVDAQRMAVSARAAAAEAEALLQELRQARTSRS